MGYVRLYDERAEEYQVKREMDRLGREMATLLERTYRARRQANRNWRNAGYPRKHVPFLREEEAKRSADLKRGTERYGEQIMDLERLHNHILKREYVSRGVFNVIVESVAALTHSWVEGLMAEAGAKEPRPGYKTMRVDAKRIERFLANEDHTSVVEYRIDLQAKVGVDVSWAYINRLEEEYGQLKKVRWASGVSSGTLQLTTEKGTFRVPFGDRAFPSKLYTPGDVAALEQALKNYRKREQEGVEYCEYV